MSDPIAAYGGVFPLMEIIRSSIDEVYKDMKHTSSYEFRVNNIDDINFKKIADDLSYADPLRIVEHEGKYWAVVHHTINDKYLRSEMYHESIMSNGPISAGVGAIMSKDIKHIVSDIHKIKQAKWTDGKK